LTKNIRWGEFRIADLFDVIKRGKRIKSLDRIEGDLPFITAGVGERGLSSYIGNSEAEIFPANSLTIDMFGTVFYRSHKYGADDHVAIVYSDAKNYSKQALLFIGACIEKNIEGKFDYFRNFYASDVYDIAVMLPMIDEKTPDFDYMEAYIYELEKERIRKLEAYLQAAGLDNYTLNSEEKEAIDNYRKNKVNYGDFIIGGKDGLFDIHPTRAYKFTNADLFKEKGNTPVVSNTSINNGIGGYSNLKRTEKGNMIIFSDTTTSESIFYQPDDFIGYPHVQGLYAKNDLPWNQNSLLYFVTLFKKCTKGRFDYANKFTREIANKMVVKLPVKSNNENEIDFDFINNFIKVQQKFAIKDVILWKDEIINAK